MRTIRDVSSPLKMGSHIPGFSSRNGTALASSPCAVSNRKPSSGSAGSNYPVDKTRWNVSGIQPANSTVAAVPLELNDSAKTKKGPPEGDPFSIPIKEDRTNPERTGKP